MSVLFIQYPPCSTCKKAKQWLLEHQVEFEERHIVRDPPTVSELEEWLSVSGLPLKKFFNTSGNRYKELNLKERLAQLSQEEQLQLLASDGMLVKRPLVISSKGVLVGFRPAQWEEML